MIHDLFRILIALHITTGAIGAISFWIPVLGRKGGASHRRWGKIFTRVLLATGIFAIGISLLTLIDPYTTHPQLVGQFDTDFIRGIFGWMMLFLGTLTINLTWYGWLCVRHKQDRSAMREWRNLALQPLLILAALNCALQGLSINQFLMVAISFVGISVYTAFMAFGSIRIFPALALNPIMWAIPLTTGVSIIIWHWWKLDGGYRYYVGLVARIFRKTSASGT